MKITIQLVQPTLCSLCSGYNAMCHILILIYDRTHKSINTHKEAKTHPENPTFTKHVLANPRHSIFVGFVDCKMHSCVSAQQCDIVLYKCKLFTGMNIMFMIFSFYPNNGILYPAPDLQSLIQMVN